MSQPVRFAFLLTFALSGLCASVPVFAATAAAPAAKPVHASPPIAAATPATSAPSSLANIKTPPSAEAIALQQAKLLVNQFAQCVNNQSYVERLSCYDALAQQMGLASAETKSKQDKILSTFGFWQVLESEDQAGRDETFLKLESINTITSDQGFAFHPVMTLKCKQQSTDVYIDWKYALGTSEGSRKSPIRFTIDAMPEISEDWLLSDDSFAVYAPDSARMIRALRKHNKIVVSLTPLGEATKTVSYDLKGFDSALDILIKRCYPPGQPIPDQESQDDSVE